MTQKSLLDEMLERYRELPPDQQQEMRELAAAGTADMAVWCPQPGAQTRAYYSEADELFYGGQAGGGKTDLLIGLAMTAHTDSLILRRENNQARKLSDRVEGITGNTDGRSLSPIVQWKFRDRTIELGGCQHEKDKEKRKGMAHDLKAFDEICDFTKSQYVFIKTWNRSVKEGQRCRVVATGNPPTTAEGLWVIEYWAPWLDPRFPNPAEDGELRWVISDANGNDKWVDGPGTYELTDDDGKTQTVTAKSRTFIRAKLEDNIYLKNTDYGATLDALPLELRAAYRDGAFDKSLKDNSKQVIPTSWVLAAVERGKEQPRVPHDVPMCAIGVDPTGGGDDECTLAPRHDGYYPPLIVVPGKSVPFGKDIAGLIVANRRDGALPIVDVGGGYGGTTCEKLQENDIKYYAYDGSKPVATRDKSGKLKMANKRAETYWRFREALDPSQAGGSPIILPNDSKLIADLCAPTFEVTVRGILVEPKEEIKARLGRSPDRGDAVTMAWCEGAKLSQIKDGNWKNVGRQNFPQAVLGHQDRRRGRR